MKQLVYDLVIFLHLVDYHDSRMKMLIAMYKDEVELEPDALINIIDSISTDLKNKNRDQAILDCILDYKNKILNEYEY